MQIKAELANYMKNEFPLFPIPGTENCLHHSLLNLHLYKCLICLDLPSLKNLK